MSHAVPAHITKFRALVWNFYRHEGRHTLPWRPPALKFRRDKATLDPYRITVSEVMLQQTQVARVLLYYPLFLKRFSTFPALAKAPLSEILKAWQGLGYNRRAVSLHRLAAAIMKKYKGKLPRDPAVLEKLPGIGRATAGAIAAFAFNVPVVFTETNIRRVFMYHFFPKRKNVKEEEITALVARTLDRKNPREWYYALMDYGAWLAKHVKNPNRRHARYRRQSKFEGSSRELRGKMVRHILSHPRITAHGIARILKEPLPRVKKTLAALKREHIL